MHRRSKIILFFFVSCGREDSTFVVFEGPSCRLLEGVVLVLVLEGVLELLKLREGPEFVATFSEKSTCCSQGENFF